MTEAVNSQAYRYNGDCKATKAPTSPFDLGIPLALQLLFKQLGRGMQLSSNVPLNQRPSTQTAGFFKG